MKITVDTNILIRFFIKDDKVQTQKVWDIFFEAEEIFIPITVLCEVVWVLSFSYKLNNNLIAEKLKQLIKIPIIIVDKSAVNFGIKCLELNGDFADGVNAFLGTEFFGDNSAKFISFDKKAVKILNSMGIDTILMV